MNRQCYDKGGPGADPAFDFDIAAVLFDESVTDGQAQTDTFDFTLGGKKTVEDLVNVLFSDTGAGIGYFDGNFFAVTAGDHSQGATVGHGIPCVCNHIQENLTQLIFGCVYQAYFFGVCSDDIDIVFPE
jgi:hypothetical protein